MPLFLVFFIKLLEIEGMIFIFEWVLKIINWKIHFFIIFQRNEKELRMYFCFMEN